MDLLVGREVAVGLVAAGGVLLAAALLLIAARARARRSGQLVGVDRPNAHGTFLRADRYRLAGRPDAIRQLTDGRSVPVELKRRGTPRGGPPYSHRLQVAAYCLLIEETSGTPPPYGLLRYSDGGEFRILWDREARADLLGVRAAVDRPYRGAATPSPGRCRRCAFRDVCDVRAGA